MVEWITSPGLTPYPEAIAFMEDRVAKIANGTAPEAIWLVEHPPLYTAGTSAKDSDLIDHDQFPVFEARRGGEYTYHGPGQIVGYPILDLENFFTDIHKYLRLLEEAIILTLAEYGLDSGRSEGETGVWLGVGTPFARKICAMGVRASRWVTMHGFALNVNTDLGYFDNIIPCGIRGKAVTSMHAELGKETSEALVKTKILHHFSVLFEAEITN